ncbi:MAG TPA: hypothetical protein VN200_10790, partial [Rhodoglobus sp.]|nr:hypothetical protein [Rhodoglobus sp.]
LPKREAGWQAAMIKRAERYADAVVVTSHAAGEVLAERTRLGTRVRVVPPAPLLDPAGEDRTGAIVLLVGRDTEDAEPLAKRIGQALGEEVRVERTDAGSGLAPSVAGARLVIHLGDGNTFPYAALHAMAGGTPLAIRANPVALETVADAAEVFDAADTDAIVEAAQRALRRADQLTVLGQDRAKAYTWRSAAEKVWQLHADL